MRETRIKETTMHTERIITISSIDCSECRTEIPRDVEVWWVEGVGVYCLSCWGKKTGVPVIVVGDAAEAGKLPASAVKAAVAEMSKESPAFSVLDRTGQDVEDALSPQRVHMLQTIQKASTDAGGYVQLSNLDPRPLASQIQDMLTRGYLKGDHNSVHLTGKALVRISPQVFPKGFETISLESDTLCKLCLAPLKQGQGAYWKTQDGGGIFCPACVWEDTKSSAALDKDDLLHLRDLVRFMDEEGTNWAPSYVVGEFRAQSMARRGLIVRFPNLTVELTDRAKRILLENPMAEPDCNIANLRLVAESVSQDKWVDPPKLGLSLQDIHQLENAGVLRVKAVGRGFDIELTKTGQDRLADKNPLLSETIREETGTVLYPLSDNEAKLLKEILDAGGIKPFLGVESAPLERCIAMGFLEFDQGRVSITKIGKFYYDAWAKKPNAKDVLEDPKPLEEILAEAAPIELIRNLQQVIGASKNRRSMVNPHSLDLYNYHLYDLQKKGFLIVLEATQNGFFVHITDLGKKTAAHQMREDFQKILAKSIYSWAQKRSLDLPEAILALYQKMGLLDARDNGREISLTQRAIEFYNKDSKEMPVQTDTPVETKAKEPRRVVFCIQESRDRRTVAQQQVAVLQAIASLDGEDLVAVLAYSGCHARLVGNGLQNGPGLVAADCALDLLLAAKVPDLKPGLDQASRVIAEAQRYLGEEGGDIILLSHQDIFKSECVKAIATLGKRSRVHVVHLGVLNPDADTADSGSGVAMVTRAPNPKEHSWHQVLPEDFGTLGSVLTEICYVMEPPYKGFLVGDKVAVVGYGACDVIEVLGNDGLKVRCERNVPASNCTRIPA